MINHPGLINIVDILLKMLNIALMKDMTKPVLNQLVEVFWKEIWQKIL